MKFVKKSESGKEPSKSATISKKKQNQNMKFLNDIEEKLKEHKKSQSCVQKHERFMCEIKHKDCHKTQKYIQQQ